jgi:hypothetical protein
VFLCAPGDGRLPSVYQADSTTLGLLSKGYTAPEAVAGSATPGDNVGKFHLTCAVDESLHFTGQFVDHNGAIYNVQINPLGNYPIYR